MTPEIERVERTPVQVPLRDRPEHHFQREHAYYNYHDIYEITLSDGSVGYGDRSIGWPLGDRTEAYDDVVGRDALTSLWDDTLPGAIQQALFDAAGRSLGVPAHRLLGQKRRDRTPLAWWCMDMPKEDWLAECEMAIDRGYRAVKLKGRPWRDVREQVRYLSEHLPEWFEISIDFNRMLLDGDRAVSVLEDLDQYPQFTSVEGPIVYDDLEGNRTIQEAIDADLLLHYGSVSTKSAVCRGIPDGFVFYGAPASGSMRQAHLTAEADIPGFLQYPGTGLDQYVLTMSEDRSVTTDQVPPDFDTLPIRAGVGTFMDPHPRRLRFIKQLGVDDILLNLWGAKESGYPNLPLRGEREWSFQNLLWLRNQVEEAGLRLNAIENLPYSFYDDIMLGRDGRDEQLEHLKNTIRNMGRAGITRLGYNWLPNGVWRSSTTYPIRGGAESSMLDMRQLQHAPNTHDRTYTEAEMWDHYEYFLESVLPVAEEAGVTLALHPDDPPVESIGGIARLFRSPDRLQQAMDLVPSNAHALQFCLGNFSAMGADIPAAIQRFGPRGEIEYVHFQTVSDSLPAFHEVFIDQDGYYDPEAVIRALIETGFSGMIIPGHAPKMEGDTRWLDHNDQTELDVNSEGWKERGRAFTVGYLRGLIDSYRHESEE